MFNGAFPIDPMHINVSNMWSKKKNLPIRCSECNARLPVQAEACSDCGYPVTAARERNGGLDSARSAEMEYKLVQLLGAVVFAAGVFAAFAESPIAAGVALTIGGATYLSGLMGSWWNSGD